MGGGARARLECRDLRAAVAPAWGERRQKRGACVVYVVQARPKEPLSVAWMNQLAPDCEEPCLAKKLALLSVT